MEGDDSMFGAVRTRTETKTNLTSSVLKDVDDNFLGQATQTKTVSNVNQSKMAHAKQVNQQTLSDLQTLCKGLDDRIGEIGIVINDAQTYQGSEKVLNFMGHLGMKWAKDKAALHKHNRLSRLDLTQAIKEIKCYVNNTINKLGENENEYKMDVQLYKAKIDTVITKQGEATPKFTDVVAKRQQTENECQTLEESLKAGTLSQVERPGVEKAYEDKKRQLDALLLEEKTLGVILKEAQEGLPELQKSREAASQSIQSLHAMRQGMLEKFDNFVVVLERATTAMKARAAAELYTAVDPAFNKTIESVTANNVAVAGALIESWTERIRHAAIDPVKSQELLNELLDHLNQSAQTLQDSENHLKGTNPAGGYPNGTIKNN